MELVELVTVVTNLSSQVNRILTTVMKLWLTQFLGDPIESKRELFDLDDEVVREGGETGCSVKQRRV